MTPRWRNLRLGLLVVSAVAGLALVPSAGAAKSSAAKFTTGTYKGKTSTGVKLGFELGPPGSCAGKKAKYCLFQLDSQVAYANLPCPSGGADSVPEDLEPAGIPSSGVVKESFGQADVAGHQSFSLKVGKNGKISGSFKLSLSTGGGPVCSSGKITFTAKRTGRFKS